MKKILIALFVISSILFISACGKETSTEKIPSAVILNVEVNEGTASIKINNKDTNDLEVTLQEDNSNEKIDVKSISSNEAAEVEFTGLKNKTIYKVSVMDSVVGELDSERFETGIWKYNIPTGNFDESMIKIEDGIVKLEGSITDEDGTIEELFVRLDSTYNVHPQLKQVSQEEIDNNTFNVSFNELEGDVQYTATLLSNYNLGQLGGLYTAQELSSVNFATDNALNAPSISNFEVTSTSEGGFEADSRIDAKITFENVDNAAITGVIINGIKIQSPELDGNTATVSVTAEWQLRIDAILYNDGFKEVVRPISETASDAVKKIDVEIAFEEDDNGNKLIRNKFELDAINQDLAGSYILANDIVIPFGREISPIGINSEEVFTGTLDGNNFKISNVSFIQADSYFGLFAQAEGATFQNLTIEMANKLQYVNGTVIRYGGLVGENNGGTIENVKVEGESVILRGHNTTDPFNYYIGGLVGSQISGTVNNVESTVFHMSIHGESRYVGGVIGRAEGTQIAGVNVNTELVSTYQGSATYIGGVVGYAESILTETAEESEMLKITDANVVITNVEYSKTSVVGGVAGIIKSNTEINRAKVSILKVTAAKSKYVTKFGGIAGICNGKIVDVDVDVNAATNQYQAEHRMGGITAVLRSEVSYQPGVIYNQAEIIGAKSILKLHNSGGVIKVGGAVGENLDGIIKNVQSTLEVSGYFSLISAGGVVGESLGEKAQLINTDGTIQNTVLTVQYDIILGGVAGKNGIDSLVENASGRVVATKLYTMGIRHNYYRLDTLVGGIVAHNYGIIKNVISEIDGLFIDTTQNAYVGGTIAIHNSNDENGVYENATIGGLLENALVTKYNVEVLDYTETEIYYGDIIASLEVANVTDETTGENTCGVFNTYTYGLKDINITKVYENDTDVEVNHTIEELVITDTVEATELTSTFFTETMLLDSTVWNVELEIPVLIMISQLWGV